MNTSRFSWQILFFIVANFSMTDSQGLKTCPRGKFGVKCRQTCYCDWTGAKFCHQRTGQCICHTGFQGSLCEEDIDECHTNGATACPAKFTACENTFGSYNCRCQRGYERNPLSLQCKLCPNRNGEGCKRSARCHCIWENTLSCNLATGECLCEDGWQGDRCDVSIDDCIWKPCGGMLCLDLHRTFSCICGENKRFIRGKCRVEIVEMISPNQKLNVGDMARIYFLFSLDIIYQWNYLEQPNFVYLLSGKPDVVQEFVPCRVDLHQQAKRFQGNEHFITNLNKNVDYHFYIEIFIRILREGDVLVTAIPEIKEYTELSLQFESRSDPLVSKCLENITLVNRSDDMRHAVPYDQGKFNTFEVRFTIKDDCNEIPTIEWRYFTLSKNIINNPQNCMLEKDLFLIDIPARILESSQSSITNQDEEKDVIPANVLPAGLIYVCVQVFFKVTSFMDCTFIDIKPNPRLTGFFNPPMTFLEWHNDRHLTVVANFHIVDADARSSIEVDFEVSNSTECSSYVVEAKYLKYYSELMPHDAKCEIHITVRIRYHPETEIKHSLEVNFVSTVDSLKTILISARCGSGCLQSVGTMDMIVYYFYPYYNNTEIEKHSKLWIFWQIEENGKQLSFERLKEILYNKKGSTSLSTKRSSLLPDSEYIFTAILQTYMYKGPEHGYLVGRSSRLALRVRTRGAPRGKGCFISPSTGLPISTNFIVNCTDYEDEEYHQDLFYRLYQRVTLPNGEHVYTIVAYGSSSTIGPVRLSPSMENGTFTRQVELKVEIMNVARSITLVPISFKFQSLTDEINFRKFVRNLDKFEIKNQEDLRTVKDIATILNLVTDVPYDARIEARNKLLHIITDVRIKNFETLELVSYILMSLSDKENEMQEDGLNNGVNVIGKLTKMLTDFAEQNIETAEHIAKLQALATSPLVSKASDLGSSIETQDLPSEKKDLKLKENLRRGIGITDSVTTISEILMKTLAISQQSLQLSTTHLDLSVETNEINETSEINLGSPDVNASFSLPSMSLGASGENIISKLEIYKKNPFSGASLSLHGNLPLMNIKFYEKQPDTVKTVQRSFRFSEPADIFLDLNSSSTVPTEYNLLLQLSTHQGEYYVTRSACLFMSIQVSTKHATVFHIKSLDNLEVLVKARYTNTISAFEKLFDEEMLSLPLQSLEYMNSSIGPITRGKNLIFLPLLQKFQVRRYIKYYRVIIRCRLHQRIREPIRMSNNTSFYNTTIMVTPYQMSCLHFDKKTRTFLTDKCMLTKFSSLEKLHCQCVTAAAFTGSYLVLPRLINPLSAGLFLKIFENPLVVTMVIALWMIALAAFLYGRRKDKEDKIKRVVTVLEDNREDHTFVYLLCVVTGWFARASTTSNIFFTVKGSWDKSESHLLSDPNKRLFQSGEENWFLLTTKDDLGDIESIEVWIDFSGGHPSWYLKCIYIQNMVTDESWVCTYDNWFSCELGERKLRADIPAIKEKDFTSQQRLQFVSRSKHDMRNEHLWIGMIAKTCNNRFTRVRRIVTGLTMLQTLMITNLMFFGLQDVDDARQFTTILGFTIHLTRILIMIQTSVIFTTIGVIVAFLFNRAAPKPSKEIEDELTEEEKELVQTNIERIVFNTAHPVNIERKHSEHNKTQQLRNTSLFGMWFGSNESSLREKTTSQSTLHLDESPKNIFLDIEAAESEIEQSHIDLLNCFQLPWWFIYITWILLTLYNVFLAYYIMLYGLSLGYEKSVDWTIGFLTSVLTDVIIFQPVKVVLIAFIVILVLKQKYSLRDQAPIAKHKECLELLFHSQTIRKKIGLKRTNVVYQIPLNATDFKEVLERLKVESLAREMMRDFVLYIIFMFCILLVVYGNLDVFTRYQQIQYTQNVYLGIRESRGENDEGVNFLADIKEHSQIWDYLKEVLLVRIAPNEKGNNLPESSYLLGPARFRQARVVPDSGVCNDLPETIRTIYNTEFCIYSMDYGKEETRSYVHTWETLYEGDAEDLEESSYVYKSAEQLRTASFTGQHGTYSGGGFVVNMSREDLKLAQQTLQNIQDSDWLDQHTRCIFVEFTLYNPSSDLFTNVILAFEFDVTGGIFPYYSVSAARFYLTNARKDNWLQIAEGITAICAVFYTVLELYIAIDKGITNYLTNFWNCLEVFVLLLSYIVGILYLARQVAYLQAIDTFNLFGHARFIDFQTVFYRTFLFNTSISALGALAIFKMLKVLTFNPFLVTYTKTMETIQSGFIAFTGISAIYLLAFAFSGMLIFGPYVFGYMSLDRALFNLLFFILGEADYDNIIADNIVLGPTYFLIVMLVTQYIIMNFYVAILREGLELARYMSFEKENATIKYMFRVLLLSLGMAPQNIRRALSDFL